MIYDSKYKNHLYIFESTCSFIWCHSLDLYFDMELGWFLFSALFYFVKKKRKQNFLHKKIHNLLALSTKAEREPSYSFLCKAHDDLSILLYSHFHFCKSQRAQLIDQYCIYFLLKWSYMFQLGTPCPSERQRGFLVISNYLIFLLLSFILYFCLRRVLNSWNRVLWRSCFEEFKKDM